MGSSSFDNALGVGNFGDSNDELEYIETHELIKQLEIDYKNAIDETAANLGVMQFRTTADATQILILGINLWDL